MLCFQKLFVFSVVGLLSYCPLFHCIVNFFLLVCAHLHWYLVPYYNCLIRLNLEYRYTDMHLFYDNMQLKLLLFLHVLYAWFNKPTFAVKINTWYCKLLVIVFRLHILFIFTSWHGYARHICRRTFSKQKLNLYTNIYYCEFNVIYFDWQLFAGRPTANISTI